MKSALILAGALWWLLLPNKIVALAHHRSRLFASFEPTATILSKPLVDVKTAAKTRYACKKFRRYDGNNSSDITASTSNPRVIAEAMQCLDIARQAPNAFNTQPYKMILVHTPAKKLALSKCVLGPNAARIRDSDCTAVFIADKQICGTLKRHTEFMISTSKPDRIPTPRMLRTMWVAIILFSSGYPLPRIIAAPISFIVRTGVSILNIFIQRFFLLPTLGNAETWATKHTMLVAMTYMLLCTSSGLATIPMEGFNAAAIRKQLKIPSRYSIPVIISTGMPYIDVETESLMKNAGTRRYPREEVIYNDSFGGKSP